MLSAPRRNAHVNAIFRPRSTDPVALHQAVGDQSADDVAAHADEIRHRGEEADGEKRHAASGAQVQRQPGPVERGDRAGEYPDQEQPQHLAILNELTQADGGCRRRGCRAGRLHRQRRHRRLVREDREPRDEPQQTRAETE